MSIFPIMIDSGAYSAWSNGTAIDLDKYITFCTQVQKDYPQAVIVSLDVLGDGKKSFENWNTMRKAGINALPVYHVVSPEKWLKKYLAETDHIGLGAIANLSTRQRKSALDRIWENFLIDPNTRFPSVKVHGMGITAFELVKRYPWYSLDSISWLMVAMYGYILVPRTRNGVWDFSLTPMKVGTSTECTAKKIRGQHYDTLTPTEKDIVLRYLHEKGFLLGFECKGEKGSKVFLKGVSTWHGKRSDICLEFYASYLASVPWPRQFMVNRSPKGLGITHERQDTDNTPLLGRRRVSRRKLHSEAQEKAAPYGGSTLLLRATEGWGDVEAPARPEGKVIEAKVTPQNGTEHFIQGAEDGRNGIAPEQDDLFYLRGFLWGKFNKNFEVLLKD